MSSYNVNPSYTHRQHFYSRTQTVAPYALQQIEVRLAAKPAADFATERDAIVQNLNSSAERLDRKGFPHIGASSKARALRQLAVQVKKMTPRKDSSVLDGWNGTNSKSPALHTRDDSGFIDTDALADPGEFGVNPWDELQMEGPRRSVLESTSASQSTQTIASLLLTYLHRIEMQNEVELRNVDHPTLDAIDPKPVCLSFSNRHPNIMLSYTDKNGTMVRKTVVRSEAGEFELESNGHRVFQETLLSHLTWALLHDQLRSCTGANQTWVTQDSRIEPAGFLAQNPHCPCLIVGVPNGELKLYYRDATKNVKTVRLHLTTTPLNHRELAVSATGNTFYPLGAYLALIDNRHRIFRHTDEEGSFA